MTEPRSFVDLHCHTSASFDSLASPANVMAAAVRRGLTHLAITDHDRIDGALRARDAAPDGLTIIIGEEVRTSDGDLIAVFLSEAVPPGMSAADTISAVRDQGGLVGMPHPFDRFRGSLGKGREEDALRDLAARVDWIEAWNARLLVGDGNALAAELARLMGKPGVAVSDAHTTVEVGVAFTTLDGEPNTAASLRTGLASRLELATGRGSAYSRLVTPLAKVVNRARGRGRVRVGSRS